MADERSLRLVTSPPVGSFWELGQCVGLGRGIIRKSIDLELERLARERAGDESARISPEHARRRARRLALDSPPPEETVQVVGRLLQLRPTREDRRLAWAKRLHGFLLALPPAADKEAAERLLTTVATRGLLLQHGDDAHVLGLMLLVLECRNWLRGPEAWQPPPLRDVGAQWTSLLRHLVARYPASPCLERAWVQLSARAERRWHLHVARGGSLRTAPDLPFRPTRAEAHAFTRAPADLDARPALRWAQVVAMGGTPEQARAVAETRLGLDFTHQAFWRTVIAWLLEHPEVGVAHYQRVVDWIDQQRHEAAPVADAPPQPRLTMRGRTPQRLLAEVTRWEDRRPPPVSAARMLLNCPAAPRTYVREDGGRRVVLEFVELTTTSSILEEGRRLEHCLADPSSFDRLAGCSLWSLRERADDDAPPRPRVTITVRGPSIVEARGHANAPPTAEERAWILRWADDVGLKIERDVLE